jgi:hypothetical protein
LLHSVRNEIELFILCHCEGAKRPRQSHFHPSQVARPLCEIYSKIATLIVSDLRGRGEFILMVVKYACTC